MVTKVLKSLFYTIFTFCYVSANAYDFQSNGVYYNILSEEEATVEVTSEYEGAESYAGYIEIPEVVSYRWSGEYTVVAVGNYAFSHCQLDYISLPSTIKRIGDSAFSNCTGLSYLSLPQEVEYIGDYAFYCSDFGGSLIIPSSCKYVGNSSFFETNISSLTFEPIYTVQFNNLCRIGDTAFGNCDFLTTADLKGLFYNIGTNPFMRCDNLTTIDGWGGYTNQEETQGNLLIDGCLYSFKEKDGIRSLELICCPAGMDQFSSPNSYTGIEKKTHVLISLGSTSFGGCSKITSLDIPNTVEKIGYMSLVLPADGEDNIYRRVNIPESVEEIGSFAFGWFGYNWDIYIHSTKIKNFSSGVNPVGRKYGDVHILRGTKASFIENNPNVENGFNVVDDIIDNIDVTANQGDTGEYWATFYSDITHYKVSSGTKVFKVNLTGTTLTMSEITDGIVTKGQGVVLKASSASITMTPNASASSDNYSDNSLLGTMTSITNPGNAYVLNYKAETGAGFYKLKNSGTIGANKAYLTYSGVLAREFFGFDETTGIKIPTVEGYDDTGAVVYDLQGRRVQNPTKGLYIVNGKKVFINK
jgi:hypothetical protein